MTPRRSLRYVVRCNGGEIFALPMTSMADRPAAAAMALHIIPTTRWPDCTFSVSVFPAREPARWRT